MALSQYISAVICVLMVDHVAAYDDRCPRGLSGSVEVFECKCYEFQSNSAEWSRGRCGSGRLALVKTERLNTFLKQKLPEALSDVDAGAWIGARRASLSSPFKWIDGSDFEFTNWVDGEPDTIPLLNPQNCVYMKKEFFWRWASLQCTGLGSKVGAICEHDIKNCTLAVDDDKLGTGALIGIVVGSVFGGLLVCLLLCCLIMKCGSACRRVRKKRRQQRSVRYYSRPPSASYASQRSTEPRCEVDEEENDLNERLVMGAAASRTEGDGDDDSILNVKGHTLPTAQSIAAEAEEQKQGQVFNMQTGRATVKRINAPNRADNASTRSLKSFKMDDQVSAQLSTEDQRSNRLSTGGSISSNDGNVVLSNLDNVDKPFSHPSKLL